MIKLAVFVCNPFRENTYILSNDAKECMIVDPGNYTPNEDALLTKYITDNNLKPVMIVATHGHVDHVLGVNFLKERYGIPFAMNGADQYLLHTLKQHAEMYGMEIEKAPDVDVNLENMTELTFGQDTIEIIKTPGHTPGGVILFVREQKFLLSGDTLFRDSIGRTDLPGGDYKVLMTSLVERVITLGDEVRVHPGHGDATSIGHELLNNPFIVEVLNEEVHY